MKNLLNLFSIIILIFSTTFLFLYSTSITKAYSQPVASQQSIGGPLSGLVQNANGKVDWVISGDWKSTLLSNTNNQKTSNVFDATIEMIKPDGTGRHVHTLNFTVTDLSYPNNNMIMYNGFSTVTMKEGTTISNVPTTLLLSNNNIISIMLDPNTVQHHFGDTPFYGVIASNNVPANGIMNGLQKGPIGGLLHGSINGLTNGILHGSMNGIMNGLQNGPIGGLFQGLLHH
jgi:hypothetical protein